MQFLIVNEESERTEVLKTLLRQLYRHARFSEARDWAQAGRALQHDAFDLCVVDRHGGGADCRADLEALLQRHPGLKVAVLVDVGDAASVVPMLHAGVLGVIPRDMDGRLVVRALSLVLHGGYYVPAGVLGAALPAPAARVPVVLAGTFERRSDAPGSLLSPRQRQIMGLLPFGNTNKEIARALGISEGTVKIHLASVFRQLGATNRASAVAIYHGWQYGTLQSRRGERPPLAGAQNDAGERLRAAEPPLPYRRPRRRKRSETG